MAGEKKRTVSESEEEMQDIQGVLVDIEGTTSSISFVKVRTSSQHRRVCYFRPLYPFK